MVTFTNAGRRLSEVQCKSVLNKSGLADYAVNCYAGCDHACVYCYARFATRFSHPGEPWGTFVDVKVNSPEILAKEVKRRGAGTVFLSSVCDAWQPSEAIYGLTRQCLEILLRHGYQVRTLTKSTLARRDLDLLASTGGVEFGVTVTTLDESIRGLIEPGSSPSAGRLALLEEARGKGIRTYAFLGPLVPFLCDTEENIEALLTAVRDVGVDYVYADRLNRRFGVWPALKSLLEEYFPDTLTRYRSIFFDESASQEYSERLMLSVQRLARRHGLEDRLRVCF